ncbi:MAG: hypothetical protein M1835_001586 [Candelina submexicana]|nr:MAG: hypothetical protein M1835_001586 [Candelina submexicana]
MPSLRHNDHLHAFTSPEHGEDTTTLRRTPRYHDLPAPPSEKPILADAIQNRPIDRNVKNVVLGDVQFKTWYPSFYPEELGLCPLKEEEPPGRLIYTLNNHSIYEIDGDEHKLFTQNLSLFAKLFLDNKSVFYDVNSFLYYLLVQHTTPPTTTHPPHHPHNQIIGFFSKEKQSWDNNNLACILVFPPWQRQGMGKILMGVSYELSKREGKVGGPEKRKLGYLSFWSSLLATHILSLPPKSRLTIASISAATYMLPEDIITTLKAMDVLGAPRKKGGGGGDALSTVSKAKVKNWACSNGVDLSLAVDGAGFVDPWVPLMSKEEG